MAAAPVAIALPDGASVSGLWQAPEQAQACLVLAHGAGAGMEHASMRALADGLETRGVATLRYNFLYMEQKSKRPDAPPRAHAAVRAAVAHAHDLAPHLPLFAGGRSFGGRMSSQAQALAPLPHIRGLIFFAFPLHPAGKPSIDRAAHLADVRIPMLFLQGENDALAELTLLRGVVQSLGDRAQLNTFAHADHSFHAPAKSGRKDAAIRDEMLDIAAGWISRHRAT